MIVVTVELHSAVTGKIKLLGKAIICNDGTGDAVTGHYRGSIGRRGGADLRRILTSPVRTGDVRDFPRLRLNVWHLLRRMLENAGY